MANHRMKNVLWAIASTLLLFGTTVAQADDYEVGLTCWRTQDYRGAYEALWRFRETPNGRNAQVDYMLGTSGCRLDGLRTWGGDVLEWMLRRYPLPEDCRATVSDALQNCRATSAHLDSPPISIEKLAEVIGASASARGKTYYRVGKNEPFNNFAAVRVRQLDPKEFRKRLYPLGNPQPAIEATRARVSGYRVEADGRFVLADNTAKTSDNLLRMSRFLEGYLAFLEREYGVTTPASFVTVYLVSTPEEIAKQALRLHGLKLGRATMGYSFRDDMSILAVVAPGPGFTVGTVQHELFHLTVRSRFGDIPQWLDEGIASLYEVSKCEPDTSISPKPLGGSAAVRCVGLPNWRGQVLWELRDLRPSIEKMITSDWYAFEQPDHASPSAFMVDSEEGPPSARQMAAALATARYFALYLQDNGALKPLYERLQAQRPGEVPKRNARVAALEAVDNVLGKPLDEIDTEFINWFKRLPR